MHGPLAVGLLEVTIDIAPNRDLNRIRPERGRLAVAIISVEAFDAIRVDPESVRIGPKETEAIRDRVVDVDRDGDMDLLLHFETVETGISCGDTEATLTGETFQEESISGTDAIITVGWR